MKIKIFSDQNYLPVGITYPPLFYALWGKPAEQINSVWNGVFDSYIEKGNSFFDIFSLDKADCAILPGDWEPILSNEENQKKIVEFVEKVKHSGKPLISFFSGDCSHLDLPIESDMVFRNSLYRSLRKNSDFAIPAWGSDLVEEYLDNQIPIRQKSIKPLIGFCGYLVNRNLKTNLKLILHRSEKWFLNRKVPRYHIGHVLRTQALSILSKSSLVETNFVERKKVFFDELSVNSQQQRKKEFVQNMVESDYIFCCRGSGNYSFRFYEALCCGRIPIFLDTDCVLPYDFEIDWKKYCIWVDESDISQIDRKIAEFHENISAREFIDLQYECRRIWKERIAPEGFFANFYRHFSQVLSDNTEMSLRV